MMLFCGPKSSLSASTYKSVLGDSCEDLNGVGFSWKSEMNDALAAQNHSKQAIHQKVTQSVGIQSYLKYCLHHEGELIIKKMINGSLYKQSGMCQDKE